MVAVTVTVWIGISSLAHIFRPWIPPDENALMADRPGAFMRQARHQQIPWQVMSDDVFSEARRLDKPILLLMGTGFSSLGRKVDQLMRIPEVSSSVRQDFIAVRVDLERYPSWKSHFLPLTRSNRGDTPWFQLFVIDFEGKIVAAPAHSELWPMGDDAFLFLLRAAQENYSSKNYQSLNRQQDREEFALTGGLNAGIPDVPAYVDQLVEQIEPEAGFLRTMVRPYLSPQDALLFAETGRIEDALNLIGPVFRSPATDPIDGGFFYSAQEPTWFSVNYSKVATIDSEIVEFLSLLPGSTGYSRWLLELNFDRLVEKAKTGSFVTYSYTDAAEFDRSLYYSFPPRKFARAAGDDAALWAREVLGLDVRSNIQMVPYMTDYDRFQSEAETRDSVLEAMRDFRDDDAIEEVGGDLLPQRAYVLARLLTAAASLDRDRRTDVLGEFDRLRQEMRVGFNDVYRERRDGENKQGGLSAYLNYADAALRAFQLSGQEDYVSDGYAVLKRGLFLFEASPGVLSASDPEQDQTVVEALIPEVLDSEMRSNLGQAVSLLVEYSQTGVCEDPQADMQEARTLLGSGSGAFGQTPHGLSGLARAAWLLEQSMRRVDGSGRDSS